MCCRGLASGGVDWFKRAQARRGGNPRAGGRGKAPGGCVAGYGTAIEAQSAKHDEDGQT